MDDEQNGRLFQRKAWPPQSAFSRPDAEVEDGCGSLPFDTIAKAAVVDGRVSSPWTLVQSE